MTFLDQIGGVLKSFQDPTRQPTAEEANRHYDTISRNVPHDVLASTIGPALGSLESGQLLEQIRKSTAAMSPEQRGTLLNTLLNGLASSGLDLGPLLGQAGVPAAVEQNPQAATPEDVAKVAAYAQQNNPDVFHKAMGFYARHPALVQAMGTLAVAAIAKRLFHGRPGLI